MEKRSIHDIVGGIATILVLSVTLFTIGYRISEIFAKPEPAKEDAAIKSLDKEIDAIARVVEAITELASSMEAKRAKIIETQKLIDELSKEHSQLEPIVKTDRAVLQAILNAQAEMDEKKERNNFWWNWSNGFFTGVLSSFVVSPYWLSWSKAGMARFKRWRASKKG